MEIKSIKLPFLNEFNTSKIVEEFDLKLRVQTTPFAEISYYYKEDTNIKLCNKSIEYDKYNSNEELIVREIIKCFSSTNSIVNYRIWDFSENKFVTDETKFTVRQYNSNTKDLEGNFIFEGDILKTEKGEKIRVYNRPGGFCISTPSFADTYYCDKNYWWIGLSALAEEQNQSFVTSNCKIIGNIFQNPELIKR